MWGSEYEDYRRTQRRKSLAGLLIAAAVLAIPAFFVYQYFNQNPDADLLAAARSGDRTAAQGALDAGADPNVVNRAGRTALHEAAWRGHTGVARALVSARADVNARDRRSGETPLHSAARANRADMVILLLGAGSRSSLRTLETSEPDIRGNRHPAGVTAREIAEASEFEDVVRALSGG